METEVPLCKGAIERLRAGISNGSRVALTRPAASKRKRAADDSLDNSKYDWLIKPLVPTGALQLPSSGLELVMFRSYQFKPLPLSKDMALGQSYLDDLRSLDGTGRGACPVPQALECSSAPLHVPWAWCQVLAGPHGGLDAAWASLRGRQRPRPQGAQH